MLNYVISHIHHFIIVPLSDLEGLIIAARPRYTSILLLHHHLRIILSKGILHRHTSIRLTWWHDLGLEPISIILLLIDLIAIAVLLLKL